MSDPKRISPLLDGFALGNPISSHHGVVCCPAIKENSKQKYIVKIITIPATQAQMDALLITGAYKDPADAMEYYRIIGEEVMQEAELLTSLSKLDGFLAYEGWQMEPITKRRLGYELYLVGSYKRSLEKYVRRNPVTHLEAVNLALDMCSALAVCRQAGALYVDLKPANIFMSDKKEYRIGDLGFIPMKALSYTALPDKYRSQYTPPELFDPMATLNLTMDTYAVGMILYQLYNDGQLPFQEMPPEEGLPSPVNADYELAEVIMKAIDPDPEKRWTDPQEMGRALVGYMQRNSVNDIPITPHTPLVPVEKPEVPLQAPSEVVLPQEPEDVTEETAEEATAEVPVVSREPEAGDEQPEEVIPEAAEVVPDEPVVEDETLPSEEDADSLLPHEMSDELVSIIAKADDLLAHEVLEDIVLPETTAPEDPFGFIPEDPEDVDDSDVPLDPLMEDTQEAAGKPVKTKHFASTEWKKNARKLLSAALWILVLAAVGCGIFWGYQNYYLQRIDSLTISGDQNKLVVRVESEIDERLLTVVCTDNYGNSVEEPLLAGTAEFEDLLPNTMYKIQVKIDGLHGLSGQTSDVFTTDATTNILNFSAITGAEDGSVLLNFTSDGEEPDMWTLVYTAEGEEPQRKNFEGHSVTLTGLTVGKYYTFTLEAGNKVSLSGETSITYMASRLILAQNLTVDSTDGTDLSVRWDVPGDILVDSWTVRCYNGTGHEEQLTVTDTEAYFTGIDPNISYTVEVTAFGMTQPSRVSVTEDPIAITAMEIESSQGTQLDLRWDYSGGAPAGGWLLMYTIDGNISSKTVVKSEEASAVIQPRIPGVQYGITVQAADSTTVYNGNHSYQSPAAEDFDENGLSARAITAFLVETPEEADWVYDSMGSQAVTDSFKLEEPISIVLQAGNHFYMPGTATEVLYVIRDSRGHVVPELTATSQETWRDIWYPGDDQYGELDLPKTPSYPGSYTVTVFFNGRKVAQTGFTITD